MNISNKSGREIQEEKLDETMRPYEPVIYNEEDYLNNLSIDKYDQV